jgi:transposase-like protein
VEVRPGGKPGRVYCRKITDFKQNTSYLIIKTTVPEDPKVITDKYPSYDELKEKFPQAQEQKSNTAKGFPILHQQIMNMKGWLRGIHHQCSDKHYQKYLDEYCFRTNRRNTEQYIFRNIMQRVVSIKTKTFKELKADAA